MKSLAIAAALAATLITQVAAAQGMGELVLEPKACSRDRMLNELKLQPSKGPCARVVVEQIDGDYITVSFLARGKQRGSSNSVSFAGTTKTPMRCSNNKCSLNGTMELQLDNAREIEYDSQGKERSLPSAWPAVGLCKLSSKAISCQAKSMFDASWEAKASF